MKDGENILHYVSLFAPFVSSSVSWLDCYLALDSY